jgi:hypothetical protein
MTDEKRSGFDPEVFLGELRFPDATDRVFTTDTQGFDNACLNWHHDGWSLYAAGYKQAGDILVAHVQNSGHGHDVLVYPILFNYRQFIELELKSLLQACAALRDISETGWQHHQIEKLWQQCLEHLAVVAPDSSTAEFVETGRLITELAKVDPSSFAFRYPQDKGGGPSLPGLTHINLANVRDVVDKIELMLSCARTAVDQQLECRAEMMSDTGLIGMGQYYY